MTKHLKCGNEKAKLFTTIFDENLDKAYPEDALFAGVRHYDLVVIRFFRSKKK